MKKRVYEVLIVLTIILLAFFGIKQIFLPYFFDTHDSGFHLSKLAQLVTLIKEGQFPPRWSGSLNGRLGYPVYVFSYPLPFALASLFYFLGFGLGSSLEAVFVIGYVVSGIGFYMWAKKYFSKLGSFVGSVFFLYAPYRFSLIFVRGAIGEHLAYMFVPFILLGIYQIYKKGSLRPVAWTGLLIGLAITAHSLFLPLYFPLIFVYGMMVPHIQEDKKKFKRYYKRLFISFLLAFGFSAFYLTPLIFERKYTVFDQVYTNFAHEHLVRLKQLIRSPWGYGPSLPNQEKDLMSFQLGLAQIMVVVVAMGVIAWRMMSGFLSRLKEMLLAKKLKSSALDLCILSLVAFVVGVLVMQKSLLSVFIWKNMPGLSFIDFPWRFLGMTTFAAAVCSAYVLDSLKYKKVLMVILVLAALIANRNHMRIKQPLNVNEKQFFSDLNTTTTVDEFMPKWRESGRSKKVFEGRLLSKDAKIEILKNKNGLVVFEAESSESFEVQFNNLYFPGWRGYVERDGEWKRLRLGEEIGIVDEGWRDYSKAEIDGTMRISLPKGRYRVKMEFGETRARIVGDLVSIVTLFSVGWLLLRKR